MSRTAEDMSSSSLSRSNREERSSTPSRLTARASSCTRATRDAAQDCPSAENSGNHDGDSTLTPDCRQETAPLISSAVGRGRRSRTSSSDSAAASDADDEGPCKDLGSVLNPSRYRATHRTIGDRRAGGVERGGGEAAHPLTSVTGVAAAAARKASQRQQHELCAVAAVSGTESAECTTKTTTITSVSSRTNSNSVSGGEGDQAGNGRRGSARTPAIGATSGDDSGAVRGAIFPVFAPRPSSRDDTVAAGTQYSVRHPHGQREEPQRRLAGNHNHHHGGRTSPTTAAAAGSAPQWRKVLYERQPFEDNYVDPNQFLNDLRENENVRGYRYLDVVYNTLVIVQQISLVALFTCAFGVVLTNKGGSYALVYLDGAILLMAWAMYVHFRKQSRKDFDDSDLLMFRGDYARSARDSRASTSTLAPPLHVSARAGSNGSSRPSGRQQQQPQRTRSSVATTPGGGSPLLPQDTGDHGFASVTSPRGSSPASAHTNQPWPANPLGRSPHALSPLLSGSSGHSTGTAATGTFANGNNGSNSNSCAGGSSAATSSASKGATTTTTTARGIVVVKDGSEQTHSDVPLVLGYVSDFGRKVISLGTFIVLLTPVLSTLTVTYSTDTIIALSILTMVFHVLLADYSYLNGYTDKYAPNLSVNSALFGVILMASRIPSPIESGSLIAFGAFCFSLSPIARHMVRQYSTKAHVVVTALLFALATFFLSAVPVLCFFFVSAMSMVALVIPWWFVSLHSSVKDQISGPWDEAKPTNSAAAAEWANAGLLS